MNKQLTFLMCSPRGDKSASHAIGSYVVSLFEEKNIVVKTFEIYKSLRKKERIEEMIKSIDECDIILLASPLYIDQAPYMTIKLMDIISEAFKQSKIQSKTRHLFAISNAGFLEYYHNNLVLKIYEQFAIENDLTWAGGLPIGAAGTYATYPIPEFLKMLVQLPKDDPRQEIYHKPTKILDGVIRASVDYLSKGEIVPKDELQKLEFIPMPLEAYVKGGNSTWPQAAEQHGAVDKLRDKPYER
ncbi:MAG: NAD(P)H-dependent oxidoreductase [Candidatus Heimdallarchaeota archaeon]|nr:NAD(P)H-dependent oxidoreductase [Candidatus Heimdallarchaeota archaeon]